MARAHQEADPAPYSRRRGTGGDRRLQHPVAGRRAGAIPAVTLFRPFRGRSLSVKLAALGAVVTAAVVVATFWGLNVETRNNTRDVFVAQLARNQQTLQNLQERMRRQ